MPLINIPLVSEAAPKATANKPSDVAAAFGFANSQVPSDAGGAFGRATSGAPAGNGDIVRVIGYCLHASNGQIWFNPDNTFVEVTA